MFAGMLGHQVVHRFWEPCKYHLDFSLGFLAVDDLDECFFVLASMFFVPKKNGQVL